jgi:CheY-like chemotaxis protein
MASVLLVEDVPVVRMTLVKFLERGGHSVTACGGGDEAWLRFGKSQFDVVITDLWMTNGDGLEFIQRLRISGNLTPVIAITGGDPRSPQSTSSDVALRSGANRVLLKPVTKATLLESVGECIGRE